MSKPETDAKFNVDAQVKLETAHDVIQHPDKFAEVFVNAAKSQISIKEYIQKEIVNTLQLHPESRESLKGLIKEQFNEDWKSFAMSVGGKILLGVWSLLLLGIGAWLGSIWK